MRLKVTTLALLAAALTASTAIAVPPAGKGKPPGLGEGCKPMVTVVLKGAITSASTTSLGMTVTQSNRWGRAYAEAGSATLTVTDETKVRRNGKTTGLVATDRVLVQARVCKASLANEATPTLTAVRVVAHPAKA